MKSNEMVEIDFLAYKTSNGGNRTRLRARRLPPSSPAAMVAAEADGGGGGGGSGRQVKPAHQGTLTPGKDRKRKSKQRDRTRSESLSPDSAITSTTAGGDDGVDQKLRTTATAASSHGGVVELQQQTNGKKPRLVWTPELHELFVKACKKLEETGSKVVPKNILKAMNVSGLTRENVASHLQKYRQNEQARAGRTVRRRGKGGATAMVHHIAPTLQPTLPQAQPVDPDFPQAQPVNPAFPQAPSPSNPPHHHRQGSFAAANMSHPQVGRGQGQVPNLVHQPHENFPGVMEPQVFYLPSQLQAIEQQRQMTVMKQQAQRDAARMTTQAAVAPGHISHHPIAMNYELGAQIARNPAAGMASGVQSHRLQPHTPAVNMSGGLYCPVPQASTIDVQMETSMGVAQLQINVESAVGQAPADEPAFAGSDDPDDDGGHQEDSSCGILRFWNTASAPSVDHDFPPNKPA